MTIRSLGVRWLARRPSRSVIGSLALGALAVWVIVGQATTYFSGAVTSRVVWFAVVAIVAVAVALGAWTARYRPWVAIAIGAVVAMVAVVSVVGGVPTQRFSELFRSLGLAHSQGTGRGAALVVALVAVAFLVAFGVGRFRGTALRSTQLLVVGTITLWLLADIVFLRSHGMRDLGIYLEAGRAFLHGGSPYALEPLTAVPKDPTALPFLYPPPTIPLFAALASLPAAVATATWLLVSGVATVVTLRSFGLLWRWIPIFFLWPAIFEGLWVGNIVLVAVVLFAIAPRFPAGLVLGVLSKVQFGIPSLWLVRERRWRGLASGMGLLVGVTLLTLPLVGMTSWRQWLDALGLFQREQLAYHTLYGFALPQFVPYAAYLLIAVIAVVAAFVLGRGLRGLARLALASIVASPSLYRHGFVAAMPGLLGNDEILVWLALGLATLPRLGWWALAVIAIIGTFQTHKDRGLDTVHPLGRSTEPWAVLAPGAWTPDVGGTTRPSTDPNPVGSISRA